MAQTPQPYINPYLSLDYLFVHHKPTWRLNPPLKIAMDLHVSNGGLNQVPVTVTLQRSLFSESANPEGIVFLMRDVLKDFLELTTPDSLYININR